MNRLSILSDRFLRCSYILTVAAYVLLSLPLLASEQQDGYRLLRLEGYLVKWGEQQLGTGAKISYAFADETLDFDYARNADIILGAQGQPRRRAFANLTSAPREKDGVRGIRHLYGNRTSDRRLVTGTDLTESAL